ncbi:class I SAM-dependent methyltransferase [Nitrospirota bacterium]
MPMDDLERTIRKRIASKGPMSFREFMDAALYEPGQGYYTRPETEIGREGDFYTSPHAHRIFGVMMGRQAIEFWEQMGRPGSFDIVEYGAGRGWLCRDILDYLMGKDIYGCIRYTVIELNPAMAARQRELLSRHEGVVQWADIPSNAGPVKGIILSNELIDALPVHLVEHGPDGWREVHIVLEGNELTEALLPLSSDELGAYLEEYAPVRPEGMRTEVNLGTREWLKEVSDLLEEGFVLTIDYGYRASDYYDEERRRGTLLCYREHETTENYLSYIGQQDITAHVNFTDIRRQGEALGLRTLGWARQGIYLVSLGIDEAIVELYGQNPEMGREAQMVHNLIMPGTMGDTHKVLMQYRGEGTPELRGFTMKNEKEKLA